MPAVTCELTDLPSGASWSVPRPTMHTVGGVAFLEVDAVLPALTGHRIEVACPQPRADGVRRLLARVGYTFARGGVTVYRVEDAEIVDET